MTDAALALFEDLARRGDELNPELVIMVISELRTLRVALAHRGAADRIEALTKERDEWKVKAEERVDAKELAAALSEGVRLLGRGDHYRDSMLDAREQITDQARQIATLETTLKLDAEEKSKLHDYMSRLASERDSWKTRHAAMDEACAELRRMLRIAKGEFDANLADTRTR